MLVPVLVVAQDSTASAGRDATVSIGLGYGNLSHGTSFPSVGAASLALRAAGGSGMFRLAFNLDVGAVTAEHDINFAQNNVTGTLTCSENCAHIVTSLFLGAEVHPKLGGFYATSGVGFSFENFVFSGDDEVLSLDGARGFSYLVGAGYDIRFGASRVITPFVHYIAAPKFDTAEPSRNGAAMNRLLFGLGFGVSK